MKIILLLSLLSFSLFADELLAPPPDPGIWGDCRIIVSNMGKTISAKNPLLGSALTEPMIDEITSRLTYYDLDAFTLWQSLADFGSHELNHHPAAFKTLGDLIPIELARALRRHPGHRRSEKFWDHYRPFLRELAFLRRDLGDPEVDGVENLQKYLTAREYLRLKAIISLPKAYPQFFREFLAALARYWSGQSTLPVADIESAIKEVLAHLQLDHKVGFDQWRFLAKAMTSSASHCFAEGKTCGEIDLKASFYVVGSNLLRERLSFCSHAARLREDGSISSLHLLTPSLENFLGIRHTGTVAEIREAESLATAIEISDEGGQIVGLGKRGVARLLFLSGNRTAAVVSYQPASAEFRVSAVIPDDADPETAVATALTEIQVTQEALRARMTREDLPVRGELVIREGEQWPHLPNGDSVFSVRHLDAAWLEFSRLQLH